MYISACMYLLYTFHNFVIFQNIAHFVIDEG